MQNLSLPPVDDLTDAALAARLQRRLDEKTKPLGALGALEALALRVGCILGAEAPRLHAPQLLVCAGDHGLAARGVSAYPSDVTWQMVENMRAGGAAVSVLARQHGIALTVADCGVAHDFDGAKPLRAMAGAVSDNSVLPTVTLIDCKVAPGTADAATGPAMTADQCRSAVDHGRALVRTLPGNVLLLGEMGIGNSSSAALLLARLAGVPLADCVGPGTGLDAAGVRAKHAVLQAVLARHADARAPLAALAAFGGYEIAALAGAIVQAAHERRVILLDGFICGAAALVAQALAPHAVQRCIASHRSAEPGHAALLARLGLAPLLQLELRLGEGSGAALAWPLLESACRILGEMASFASAGVSERSGDA